MQGKTENSCIELERDPVDGVYKMAGIKHHQHQEEHKQRQKYQGGRRIPRRQQREVQRIAQQAISAIPEFEQFVSGAHQAMDIVERAFDIHAKLKKAMR